jgi:hypothetical protein
MISSPSTLLKPFTFPSKNFSKAKAPKLNRRPSKSLRASVILLQKTSKV